MSTSINRARVLKLVRSNNVVSKRLGEAGFTNSYDLDEALTDWQKVSGNGRFI